MVCVCVLHILCVCFVCACMYDVCDMCVDGGGIVYVTRPVILLPDLFWRQDSCTCGYCSHHYRGFFLFLFFFFLFFLS